MSGGYFDYAQHRIEDIANTIEDVIAKNEEQEFKFGHKTIKKFTEGVKALRIAGIYAQRIDWLLSSDDGESSFLQRLKSDLEELK